MSDGLTKAQQAALDMAAEAHEAFTHCTTKTAADRDRALKRVFELGVPPAEIAKTLGVSHGRVSQLGTKLGFPNRRNHT